MNEQEFAEVRALHFIELSGMTKQSGVGSAIVDSIGLALLGAAVGGAAGGAMEHDPYLVHDAMARGALIGGGIGGTAPLVVRLIGAQGKNAKGLEKLRDFRSKSADELINRASGLL